MSEALLVLNAGSSSIKWSLFVCDGDDLLLDARDQVEAVGAAHEAALAEVLARVEDRLGPRRLAGVGHRVVHGGADFSGPVRVDRAVLERLEALVPLAPLHQPHCLAPVRRLLEHDPGLPQVACFDTAFHRTAPEVAQRFALAERWFAEGVRRYGFHGLSFEYVAGVLPVVDPRAAAGRTAVLHLGHGASLCALAAGRSVATTMAFSTLDGVPMSTRPGALDPGVIFYLARAHGLPLDAIERMLYHEAGLYGVSGISGDMRKLLASGAPEARRALDLYVYRIGRELGSLAAALHGLDAIVFTGGVGEHAAPIRERIAHDAAWLGVAFDGAASVEPGRVASRLSREGSRVSAWVIPTNEELVVARHARRLLEEGT